MNQSNVQEYIKENIRIKKGGDLKKRLLMDRWLYIMLIPGVLYFIVYKYLPMLGVIVAFEDYQPYLGFLKSKWVGLEHFRTLFTENNFWMLLRNTSILGLCYLLICFPLVIVVALLINEVKHNFSSRLIQTLLYLPNFLSWVVIVGICYILFTTEGGVVNDFIVSLGGHKISFLLSSGWFRPMIVFQVIWKTTGWGTVIFLATICNIDPQLYESAKIDGAGRWKQVIHITLPSIKSTIVILFILQMGSFLDTGFEQIFLMLNPMNRDVGEVFDTYVYTVGLTQGLFSYSTAVGLFKSVVSFVLIVTSNFTIKKLGEEGIY